MKRSIICGIGALLVGAGLLALGVLVFEFDSISRMFIDFYANFSWKAVISIVIASFVPGFLIGLAIGLINFKKKGK